VLGVPDAGANVPLDERLGSVALVFAAAHHVRVDAQREARVGVAELLHHVGRIPPIATRIDANAWRSLCGVSPSGNGLQAAPLSEPGRVGHDRVDDVVAQVVSRARTARRGNEDRVIGHRPLAGRLVLGEGLSGGAIGDAVFRTGTETWAEQAVLTAWVVEAPGAVLRGGRRVPTAPVRTAAHA
jgi:hypothetical protein